jgi:hypothetical protein
MKRERRTMMEKKVLAILVMFIGITLSFTGWGKTEELTANGDILQRIINLVVEDNPAVQSQRSLLEQIQALPNPGKGLDFEVSLRGGMATYVDENDREIWAGPSASVGLEIPLFSSSGRKNRIMTRLTYAKELEKAKQDYLALKNSIISELLNKLKKLFVLLNEKKKLEELKSFLSSNTEAVREQVKTGVIKANDLWELTERIMDTETNIYNRSSELELLKREIAINLGGEKSGRLRQMLEELSIKYIEERHLE